MRLASVLSRAPRALVTTQRLAEGRPRMAGGRDLVSLLLRFSDRVTYSILLTPLMQQFDFIEEPSKGPECKKALPPRSCDP